LARFYSYFGNDRFCFPVLRRDHYHQWEFQGSTLKDGQILRANYIAFTPERGDIVIYEDHGVPIIKRVIGLPGESIEITNGQVIVNRIPLHEEYTNGLPRDLEPVTIPDDSYFLVDDNRIPGASRDSHDPAVGPIEENALKEKRFFLYTHLNS